jgi:cadmium resistance protein CadD (predicted permease)
MPVSYTFHYDNDMSLGSEPEKAVIKLTRQYLAVASSPLLLLSLLFHQAKTLRSTVAHIAAGSKMDTGCISLITASPPWLLL